MIECCGNCHFWKNKLGDYAPGLTGKQVDRDRGECHCRSPQITTIAIAELEMDDTSIDYDDAITGRWPQTVSTSWCGEWEQQKLGTTSLPAAVSGFP